MDCEVLSVASRKVFEQIAEYYPPDPWKKPQWEAEGKVREGRWYDLRLAADRKALEEFYKNSIGYSVHINAHSYRDKFGMDGFEKQTFGEFIKFKVTLLLLLSDLDFQIETGDACDEDISEINEKNRLWLKKLQEQMDETTCD